MGIIASKESIVDESFDGVNNDVDSINPETDSIAPIALSQTNQTLLKQQLERLDSAPTSVPQFSFNGNVTVGKCCKVYDGDTVHFIINYNGEWIKHRFRMMGYNSPEIRGVSAEIKAQGITPRNYLASRLLNQKVILYLHNFDKWGRILVDVYLPNESQNNESESGSLFGVHLNKEMIDSGHGSPYFGKTGPTGEDYKKWSEATTI